MVISFEWHNVKYRVLGFTIWLCLKQQYYNGEITVNDNDLQPKNTNPQSVRFSLPIKGWGGLIMLWIRRWVAVSQNFWKPLRKLSWGLFTKKFNVQCSMLICGPVVSACLHFLKSLLLWWYVHMCLCVYVCVCMRVWVRACVRVPVKGTCMQKSNLLYLHIYVTKFGKPYTVQFIHKVLLI